MIDARSLASLWLAMLAGGILTYAIRLSFILLLGRVEIPILFQRSLRYVPPAVLSAIILPELFIQDGSVNISFANFRLLAGMLAVLVAWRTKNALLTILVGMSALWIFIALSS